MFILAIMFTGMLTTGCAMKKNNQTTSSVFMVKPTNYGFNEQTAESNSFQNNIETNNISSLAISESQNYVKLLEDNGIDVVYVDDTPEPQTPDSVFPNNWFSTHENNTLVLYPMLAQNRRLERKTEFINTIKEKCNIKNVIDLTHWENENEFLEGTGSLVLDRQSKIAYACLSPRTSTKVLEDFCNQLGYNSVTFKAVDNNGKEIYHSNVMMAIFEDFSILCKDSIINEQERNSVIESLEKYGKKPIFISMDQMNKFAGNMLELKNNNNERIIIMSKTAYDSLSKDQISLIEQKCKILTPDINTIEKVGGGSARCMIAELY